jgi:uncharacterized protein (DUF983 family)
MEATPSLGRALLRGARRRCPACGHGELFEHWFRMRRSCATCGLTFEPEAGATWGFWIVMDRMFLLGAMVLLYFGFRPESVLARALFLLGVALPMVWTMPHRQGIATALDWFARTRSRT